MRVKISICLIVIILFSSISVFATDEIYVWSSNQNEITTSTQELQPEEKTGNFLRVRIC